MVRGIRTAAAALLALLAVGVAAARAEEGELTVTARLFRVKTAPFEKGLLDEKRIGLRLVFDASTVADLESLLKQSGGQCLSTASAKQASTFALSDPHEEKLIRDIDLEVQGGGVRSVPIEGKHTWGLMMNASGAYVDEAGNLRMSLTGQAGLPRAASRSMNTSLGRIDLPGTAMLGGTLPLFVPPGGATVLGGSDLEDPTYTVVLVVGTKTSAAPPAGKAATGMRGAALWWLDLEEQDTNALLKAGKHPPSIGRAQVDSARRSKTRLWAFAPVGETAPDLEVSNEQAIIEGWEEDQTGDRRAWTPRVGSYVERVRARFEASRVRADLDVTERPIPEKKVPGTKHTIVQPVHVAGTAESDLPQDAGMQDWLMPVNGSKGVPIGALLVSTRAQDR